MIDLTPEKALIFRITHIDNIQWQLANGLYCRNAEERDPNYREIGSAELIAKRAAREIPVPPLGTLSDYVPFYFTPCSPMLLNIKTGSGGVKQVAMSDIVILVTSLRRMVEVGIDFVFTDRHAYLQTATFFDDLRHLDQIDWQQLQSRNFRKDLNDPGRFERYQAEALIHRHLPATALMGIACYGSEQADRVRSEIDNAGLSLDVVVRSAWYFE